MKNTIHDLRNHLFAALEGLADTEKPMEVERAKAVADIARVLVDSAKAEVAYLQATGSKAGSGFIPTETPAIEGTAPRPRLASGGR